MAKTMATMLKADWTARNAHPQQSSARVSASWALARSFVPARAARHSREAYGPDALLPSGSAP